VAADLLMILVNKKAPSLVKDTRVYRSFDVSTDRLLLISKISLPQKWYKPRQRPKQVEEAFRVNLLEEPSIRYIYIYIYIYIKEE
jgi:hypothetical protein